MYKLETKELYKGDYVNGKNQKHPTYYENVVEPLVSKEIWNNCQDKKKRNARHYERTATYLFTNKIKCSKCGNILGGHASQKESGKKYYYYKCEQGNQRKKTTESGPFCKCKMSLVPCES